MVLICTIVDIDLDRGSFRCYVAIRGIRGKTSSAGPGLGKKSTHKDTSCFQTGFRADVRPSNPFDGVLVPAAAGIEREDLAELEEELDTGDCLRVMEGVSWVPDLDPRAPKALIAIEEEVREMLVAMPLTSLSSPSVGSLLTNSLFSKTTTT
jgi:hypothetical protein